MSGPQPAYGEDLDRALLFVANAFRYQRRKGSGVPYLTHLMQVAVTVGEFGGSEPQIIAALLHDYLEDIPGATEEELRTHFGDDVTQMVLVLSDSTTHPKPPWKGRKLAYIEAIRQAPPETRLVCAADKLHNARSILRDHRSIGPEVWDRFSASREDSLWYYQAITEALGSGWSSPLLDELREAVSLLKSLD